MFELWCKINIFDTTSGKENYKPVDHWIHWLSPVLWISYLSTGQWRSQTRRVSSKIKHKHATKLILDCDSKYGHQLKTWSKCNLKRSLHWQRPHSKKRKWCMHMMHAYEARRLNNQHLIFSHCITLFWAKDVREKGEVGFQEAEGSLPQCQTIPLATVHKIVAYFFQ